LREVERRRWWGRAARLREGWRAQGLTLRALSEKTGLSEPFLSKLERGRVSTSIANLNPDQAAPSASSWGSSSRTRRAPPAPSTTRWCGRASARPQAVPATGYTYQPMAAAGPGSAWTLRAHLPVRNRADVLTAHEGEELCSCCRARSCSRLGRREGSRSRRATASTSTQRFPPTWARTWADRRKVLMVAAPGRGPGREFGWWKGPAPAPAVRCTRRASQPGKERGLKWSDDLPRARSTARRLRHHRPREGRAGGEARRHRITSSPRAISAGRPTASRSGLQPGAQLHPLKRENGRPDGGWVRIGWDEALDLIAERSAATWPSTARSRSCHYQRTGSWGAPNS